MAMWNLAVTCGFYLNRKKKHLDDKTVTFWLWLSFHRVLEFFLFCTSFTAWRRHKRLWVLTALDSRRFASFAEPRTSQIKTPNKTKNLPFALVFCI